MQIADMERFFDRKSVLEPLKKRILDLKEGYRQNVALLGRRHIGKTVLLQKMMLDLDDEQLVPVYLDLENQDLHDMAEKISGRLLFHHVRRRGLPVADEVKALVEITQPELPTTYRCIKRIQSYLQHGKTPEAFREIISLPQIFAKESQSFCVLILDEFHALDDLMIPGSFQELGKKIMTQTRCLYVVASSLPEVTHRILSEKLSLLFGNFEIIALDVFDPKVSRAFIVDYFKDLRIKDSLINFLVDFTGGHPFFLNLICREAVALTRIYQQDEIYAPLVNQALENLLFQPWGILSGHFNLLIDQISRPRGHAMMGRLLTTLAGGKMKITQIVKVLGLRQSQVSQRLRYLTEMNIVVRNGSFYYLADKVFKFWLKNVFQGRESFLHLDPELRRKQFRREVDCCLNQFVADFQKDLSSRIIELLVCFEDEICYINGRRYRLPLFLEIRPTVSREKVARDLNMIRACAQNGEWFVVFKTQPIDENDINTVLNESRKQVVRPRKCILISLDHIEDHVRLRALQERMWIWSEEELNALLNIYNKPCIL